LIKDTPDYQQLALILGVLGDIDSLKILNQAVKGFKSGKPTIKELGITPRKYYRNLKILSDANLVRDYKSTYSLTPLGRVVHRLIICNLTGFFGLNQNSLSYLEVISKTKEIKIIDNYDDLAKFLATSIKRARTHILLATNFVDFTVLQSISNAIERNVKINTLSDPKLDYPSFFKFIKGMKKEIRPSLAKFFINPDKRHRQCSIPISLIIIDDEIALFEVPNKQFKMAVISSDKQIIKVLTDYFKELWHQSNNLNI
jgi:predicted transcriptional regulator